MTVLDDPAGFRIADRWASAPRIVALQHTLSRREAFDSSSTVEEFILQNLDAYGPFAVFVLLMASGMGLPFGEDIIVIPAGALVADGKMQWWPTLWWTYVGVVLSDTLWYLICYRFGTRILHTRWAKRFFHPRRLLEAKHQLDRRGIWLVVFARFIPGSRTYANTVAGMLHMPPWQFIVATAVPSCITAPAQLGIGYFIGSHMSTDNLGHLLIKVFGIVMLVLAATLVLNLYIAHRRSKKRAPRAKAAWLRKFRKRAVAIVMHQKLTAHDEDLQESASPNLEDVADSITTEVSSAHIDSRDGSQSRSAAKRTASSA